MKRICFLSGCLDNPGGTERVGISIANELSKKNEVHIISFSKREAPYFRISDNVIVHYLDLKNSYSSKIKTYYLIYKYLKKFKIEIVVEIDLILRIYTLPLQFMNKKLKVISWEHFYYGENLGVRLRDYCRKIAAKKSHLIITLTKKDLEIYQKNEKIVNKIINIPNPLPEFFYQKNDLRNKKIIAVGRLTSQKGFDILISNSIDFFKKYSDWTIEIYGEGEEQNKLEQLIQSNNLEGKIILNKPTRNIYKEYLNSTILLLPSRFEPFGMVLIEAMSCGVIPIAFESLGPNEIISDSLDGFLIQNPHGKEMFEKLEELVEKEDVMEWMSKNAKIKAAEYAIEKIAFKWEEAINDL